MEIIVLDEIKFDPKIELLLGKLRVNKGTMQEELVLSLIKEALPIAHPKAMFTLVGIDEKNEESVVLDGHLFNSRVLRVNLDPVHRAFPYIRTCGRELYDWKESKQDLLKKFYAEEICQMALEAAGEHLTSYLKNTYGIGKTSSMNPGSLDDWPLNEQITLFQLLGNPLEAVGVELMESMLMIPNQTVSGIRFETEENFTSCQLCPREICAYREAPFDQKLFEERYQ